MYWLVCMAATYSYKNVFFVSELKFSSIFIYLKNLHTIKYPSTILLVLFCCCFCLNIFYININTLYALLLVCFFYYFSSERDFNFYPNKEKKNKQLHKYFIYKKNYAAGTEVFIKRRSSFYAMMIYFSKLSYILSYLLINKLTFFFVYIYMEYLYKPEVYYIVFYTIVYSVYICF